MSLTGSLFPSTLALLSVVAFVAVVVLWPRLAGNHPARIAGRAGMLLGVNVLVLVTALAVLNAQFLFFTGWSDLTGSVTATSRATALQRGGPASRAAVALAHGSAAQAAQVLPPLPLRRMSRSGTITYSITGARSGLHGQVVVQLPPGYTDPARAGTRYPVLETFQGYPGAPAQWIQTMKLGTVIRHQVTARRMGPALIVSPQVEFPAGVDTECVNGAPGSPQLETWLTEDIPNWVTHTFRVRTDRAAWATIGLSTGGWCAAMAAMLHPAQYSAAIVMAGYFRPEFGPFYEPYASVSKLAKRYDLVHLAHTTPPPVAIWLETSHADPVSYSSSAALLKAARRPLALDALVLQRAGHRISIWQGLLPRSLTWLGANVPGFKPRSSLVSAIPATVSTGSPRKSRSAGLTASRR